MLVVEGLSGLRNEKCIPGMKTIAFFDIEVNPKTGQVLDAGAIRTDEAVIHDKSLPRLLHFVKDADYLCGHNILHHDLPFLQKAAGDPPYGLSKAIDTLCLSPLLFPCRSYHRLSSLAGIRD